MSQLPSYLSVKAQLSADETKPPKLWTVADEEILLSAREARSDRPEVHYLLCDNDKGNFLPDLPPSLSFSPASAPSPPLGADDELDSTSADDSHTGTDVSLLTVDGLTGPTVLFSPTATVTASLVLPSTSVVTVGITSSTGTPTVTTTTVSLPTALLAPTDGGAGTAVAVVGPDDVDTDSESDMTEAVSPPQFRGTAQEDAEKWMRHLTIYCEYRGYDDAKKLALTKVLLSDGAANWLDSQSDEIIGTFDALKTAFLTRYSTPVFMRFKGAKELFTMKQQLNQNADDYVAQMRQAARLVEADDKMLLYAALNGLRPDIAAFVTQKQPKDVKELLDAARVIELTSSPPTEKESAMSVQLALVQDQLRELTAKLDAPKVASVNRAQAQYSRSPSPRRVTFWDEESRPDRQPEYRRSDTPRRSDRGGRFRDDRSLRGRGFGRRGRGRGRPLRGTFGANSAPAPGAVYDSRQRCGRCGGEMHESFNMCVAVNKNCYLCGRKGHLSRMCRSAVQYRPTY